MPGWTDPPLPPLLRPFSFVTRYPHFLIFPSGTKPAEGAAGEVLFTSDEMSSHVAFPLVAKVLRNALHKDVELDSAVGMPPTSLDYEEERKDPPPPPPPVKYAAPPPTAFGRGRQVTSSGNRRMRLN